MTPESLLAVPPPPTAMRLASDDPDEITSWVSRLDGDHSRVVHGTGPYGFQLARIETPSVQIAWASARLANTLRGRFLRPTFHIPLRGVQQYLHGRRQLEAAPGRMMFVPEETVLTRRSAGDPIMAIDLDGSTFDSEVQSRRGGDRVDRSRVPCALDLLEAHRREVVEAIVALMQAHLPGAAVPSKVHGASRVLSALAGTLCWSASNRSAPVAIQRLKQVEEWVDAHIGEAITLGQLCKVAQASERSLQLAYHARRGMSPMRFVCERRLAAAQRRLFRSEQDDNVTAVATSLGFTHLGRFASAYFAAFGESPSTTLTRGRRWAQAGSIAASARREGWT